MYLFVVKDNNDDDDDLLRFVKNKYKESHNDITKCIRIEIFKSFSSMKHNKMRH